MTFVDCPVCADITKQGKRPTQLFNFTSQILCVGPFSYLNISFFFFMTQRVGVAFILVAAVCRFVIHGITYIWSVESLPLISLCPTVGSSTLYDRLHCFTASHDIKSLRAVESNQLSRHHVPCVAGVFSLICSNPNRACRTNMRFHRPRPRLYSHSGNIIWHDI